MMSRPPIRCVFILHDLSGGGAERVTLNLIRNLNRKLFVPTLFLFERVGELICDIPEDLPVIVGREPGEGFIAGGIRTVRALIALARTSEVIIGALEHRAIFVAALMSAWSGKPALGWVHKDLVYYASHLPPINRLIYRMLIRLSFRRLSKIIAVSHGVASALAKLLPRLRERVQVIYNPIDEGRILERSKEAVPDWAAGVLAKPVIMAVGRLEDQKGFDLLIEAHARIRECGCDHNLLIIGEGQRRAFLTEVARERGVAQSVFMPGFCNPFPLMIRSRMLALSSRFEGLPSVLIEAMMLGVPVVAARCPSGPAELLDDGRCGTLVRTEDVGELKAQLEKVLKEPESVIPLLETARKMTGRFDRATIMAQWESAIEANVSREESG